MNKATIEYIIKAYPIEDTEIILQNLERMGTKISRSQLGQLAYKLGIKRTHAARCRINRNAKIKLYQQDRERIKRGLPPKSKKIKAYKLSQRHYEMRSLFRKLGYILNKQDMFRIGYSEETYRLQKVEEKCKTLGFDFYGCADNP